MALTQDIYENRNEASKAAAERIARALAQDLNDRSEASMVVSGGSTPKNCFALLSDTEIAWDKVRILMSDERCVAPDHAASNEGMIRRLLRINCAAQAELVPIYKKGLSPDEQCTVLSEVIDASYLPFSITLLGMGEDGHFASLFPDFDGLAEGLDVESEHRCLSVGTVASSYARVTLTMSTLLQSREILLLFFGQAKLDVYEKAKCAGSDYPIARLLQQDRTPVHTIWAL